MTSTQALEDRIVDALRRIREHPGGSSVDALYRRAVGELLGDGAAVEQTLDPAFELVMHTGETTLQLPGRSVADGVRASAATGSLMWIEWSDLMVDADTIAGSGTMLTLRPAQGTLHRAPLGIFLRFRTGRMVSETVFLCGTTETTEVAAESIPSVAALRARLDAPMGDERGAI